MSASVFDPKYAHAVTNIGVGQLAVKPKVPTDGIHELTPNAVYDPASRLLDYLRANSVLDSAPTRSTRDSSGYNRGSGGSSAFDHVIAMPIIDIGRDPTEENREHSIHKGTFFITMACDEQPIDTIDYSKLDASRMYLTPSAVECAVFDFIHSDTALIGYKSITMCVMATTEIVQGHEKHVIPHSVFHHVEVLPTPLDDVAAVLTEADAKDILSILSKTELYVQRVMSSHRPLAISNDKLYIIPVVTHYGSGYKVHYIPAINLNSADIMQIKVYLNKLMPTSIRACFDHVYFVGPLLLPHREGQDHWYVSYQVDRF